jgi:hypothetical protein
MCCIVFAGEAKHEFSMSDRTVFFAMTLSKTLLRWNDILSVVCHWRVSPGLIPPLSIA